MEKMMSKLITDLSEIAPRFGSDREELQWANGKASRDEVASLIAASRNSIVTATNDQFGKMGEMLQQTFYMCRVQGMQINTLLRVIEQGIGTGLENYEGKTFKEVFEVEFKKTDKQIDFVGNLMSTQKPAKQIIQELRDWNASEDALKVAGPMINLAEIVKSELDNFTPEEVTQINQEFGINIPLELFGVKTVEGEANASSEAKEETPTEETVSAPQL